MKEEFYWALYPPKDKYNKTILVGCNVYLKHNNRIRKVVHITRSDGGNRDQWVIGCDSGGAFLLPRDEDNVTLIRECPFCGCSEPTVDSMTIVGIKRAWVGCPNCGSRGPTEAMAIGKTEEEAAVDAWNDPNWREP